jgi:hypothetical protein
VITGSAYLDDSAMRHSASRALVMLVLPVAVLVVIAVVSKVSASTRPLDRPT